MISDLCTCFNILFCFSELREHNDTQRCISVLPHRYALVPELFLLCLINQPHVYMQIADKDGNF
jgi:hypothetical protein